MATLRDQINQLASELAAQFAARLAAALRNAPVAEVAELETSLSSAPRRAAAIALAHAPAAAGTARAAIPAAKKPRRSRGTANTTAKAKKPAATRARPGVAAKSKKAPSRRKRAKRTGAIGAAGVARIAAALAHHPEGLEAASLRKAVGMKRGEWKYAIDRAREQGKVRIKGERGAAVYSLTSQAS